MRISVVALGLTVIGNQLGVAYTRALHGDVAFVASDLVDREVMVERSTQGISAAQPDANPFTPKRAEPILVLSDTIAPAPPKRGRARGRAKATQPKATPPKSTRPKSTRPTSTPSTSTPSLKPYPGQKIPSPKLAKARLAKKVKAVLVKAGPRPRVIKFKSPKKSQQKKPAHKASKPKAVARRELGEITKRSGDEHALTFSQWKQVLQLVENELKADPQLTHPMVIWCYGGVSALAIGARGENGVSADLDFHYTEPINPQVREALERAILAIGNANPDNLDQNFMNTAITGWINYGARRDIVLGASSNVLWRPERLEDSRLWVMHGPFGVSLAGKMDKITNEMLQGTGETEEKNIADAVGFLQGAVTQNGGRPISYSQVKTWSRQFGKSTSVTNRNIYYAVQRIQAALPAGKVGFAQDVFKAIEEYDSATSD